MAANCFSCSMSVLLLKAQSFRLQNRFDSPAFCKRVVISLLIKGPKFTRCSKSSEVASKIEACLKEIDSLNSELTIPEKSIYAICVKSLRQFR